MAKKFTTAVTTPVITLPIPANTVPTLPNMATNASCSVPAPPAARAKAFTSLPRAPTPLRIPPEASTLMEAFSFESIAIKDVIAPID